MTLCKVESIDFTMYFTANGNEYKGLFKWTKLWSRPGYVMPTFEYDYEYVQIIEV